MLCEECNGDGGYYLTLKGEETFYYIREGYFDFEGNKLSQDNLEWHDCEYCGGSGGYEEEDDCD